MSLDARAPEFCTCAHTPGAHQGCTQLCLNEGDLQIYRRPGGDVDNPNEVFIVRDVPEVFNTFDGLSV